MKTKSIEGKKREGSHKYETFDYLESCKRFLLFHK